MLKGGKLQAGCKLFLLTAQECAWVGNGVCLVRQLQRPAAVFYRACMGYVFAEQISRTKARLVFSERGAPQQQAVTYYMEAPGASTSVACQSSRFKSDICLMT